MHIFKDFSVKFVGIQSTKNWGYDFFENFFFHDHIRIFNEKHQTRVFLGLNRSNSLKFSMNFWSRTLCFYNFPPLKNIKKKNTVLLQKFMENLKLIELLDYLTKCSSKAVLLKIVQFLKSNKDQFFKKFLA